MHQRIQHQTLLYRSNHHRYSRWKFITVQYFLSTFGVISTEEIYNTNHYDNFFSISSEAMLSRNILKRIMLKWILLNKNISRYNYWWQWRCNYEMCCCRNFRHIIFLNEPVGRISVDDYGRCISVDRCQEMSVGIIIFEWICRNEPVGILSTLISLLEICLCNLGQCYIRNDFRMSVSADVYRNIDVRIIISADVFQYSYMSERFRMRSCLECFRRCFIIYDLHCIWSCWNVYITSFIPFGLRPHSIHSARRAT